MASLADPPGAGLLNQKYPRCMGRRLTPAHSAPVRGWFRRP